MQAAADAMLDMAELDVVRLDIGELDVPGLDGVVFELDVVAATLELLAGGLDVLLQPASSISAAPSASIRELSRGVCDMEGPFQMGDGLD